MLIALLVPLSLAILFFAVVLVKDAIAKRAGPNIEAIALGAVVSFFDTLGIGSFATTTAWFRRLDRPSLSVRATVSAGEPATYGTTIRTGLSG